MSSLPEAVTVGLGLQESSEAANIPTGHSHFNGLLREMSITLVTTAPKAVKASKTLCLFKAVLNIIQIYVCVDAHVHPL